MLVKLMWEFFVLLSQSLLSRKAKFTNADRGESFCSIVQCMSLFFHFICFFLSLNLYVFLCTFYLLDQRQRRELSWHDTTLPGRTKLCTELPTKTRQKAVVKGISAATTLLASATSSRAQRERKPLITIFKIYRPMSDFSFSSYLNVIVIDIVLLSLLSMSALNDVQKC